MASSDAKSKVAILAVVTAVKVLSIAVTLIVLFSFVKESILK